MKLHDAVLELSDKSDEFHFEANNLFYSSPYVNKMLMLFENQDIGREIMYGIDYPNCFGTAFWTFGDIETKKPIFLVLLLLMRC